MGGGKKILKRGGTPLQTMNLNRGFSLLHFFQHTLHSNLTNVILFFGVLLKEHMNVVFPMFILSTLISNTPFQFFNIIFNSSSDSAAMTKSSSSYNSSEGHPILNSCEGASITVIKGSRLSTVP